MSIHKLGLNLSIIVGNFLLYGLSLCFESIMSLLYITLIHLFSSIGYPHHLAEETHLEGPPLEILNEYVEFTNECIHGLLIVHRLLENFNQELNKKITGGQKLNFYSNDDLPKDIFEDADHWFFDTSPYVIFKKLEAFHVSNPDPKTKELHSLASRMLNICRATNQIRFDLEMYMDNNDMTLEEHQRGVFKLLENGVKMFSDFHASSLQIESALLKLHAAPSHRKRTYFNRVYQAHYTNKAILRSLRSKQDIDYKVYLKKLKTAVQDIENSNDATSALKGKLGQKHSNIVIKIIESHDNIYKFAYTALVPSEYKLYGKFYFYHNSQVINKMNRYGNGYVKEVNDLIDGLDAPELYLVEEPHFFQVTYPEVLEESTAITSSDDVIEQLPEQLLDRSVTSSERTITVDSLTFTINLYDHKLPDGDIVSINYNGDWVLQNYSLEEKPAQLEIKLNENGKNFLLLHAESIGRRPPNTMGLSYYFGGKRQEIVLKSDLNESEMIEIEYVDPDRY